MKNRSILLLAFAAGCNLFTGPGDKSPKQLTELPRSLTADELRVSRAANQFAFTLFERLNAAQPDANVFVSPLSVTFSLGLAMNGANSTTFDQMRQTLGFGAAELEEINDGYRGLLALEAGLDPSTTFDIANSVWYRQDFNVNQSFIDQVKEVFDAEVRASPFNDATKTEVNSWVSSATNGKIPTILEEIDPDDLMFLINAIYFKGSWRDQFDKARTTSQAFASIAGQQMVPMMVRGEGEGKLRFGVTPDARIGELTYGNGAFVMTIALPNDPAGIDELVAGLDTASWSALLGTMTETDYEVRLPKFKLEYERELKEDLIALGMQVPFTDAADFSRMTPSGVYIAFVKHKTYVDVNEEGTEAAAVTNTGMRPTSLPPCLCVDRPFVFAIRERFSGTILFMGKIVRIPA
jgi:serine protease inhibitor